MGRLFYSATELLRRPLMPGMTDRTQLYFHFRPARPADIVVTRDPDSGEVDVTPQTFGPLTDRPLTICLHTNRTSSPHSTRNLGRVGAEAVVALPGPELVRQTWITAVPMPRGISEAEVAGLTFFPSRVVGVPGITECPVNLECRVEFVRRQYTHNAVFLRVVGANVDEELLQQDRLSIIRRGPTYEVDDATNRWNGAIERLGTNYDLLECPGFPVILKKIHSRSALQKQSAKTGFQVDFDPEKRALIELTLGRALASVGKPEGYEILIEYLDDNRANLAEFAHMTLEELTGRNNGKDRQAWRQWLAGAKESLKPIPLLDRVDG